MSVMKKAVGTTVATAAAALFLSGAALTLAPSAAKADGVKCMGANACKGASECKSASNECKGMNACKGKGWITVGSAKDCADHGGMVAK